LSVALALASGARSSDCGEQRYETMTMKPAPGRHRTFHAGRTDHEPCFDLIPFEFLEPVADVLTRGSHVRAVQLQARAKDFFLDAWNHAFVHLQKFKEGDRSEEPSGAFGVQHGIHDLGGQERLISQDDFSAPK